MLDKTVRSDMDIYRRKTGRPGSMLGALGQRKYALYEAMLCSFCISGAYNHFNQHVIFCFVKAEMGGPK